MSLLDGAGADHPRHGVQVVGTVREERAFGEAGRTAGVEDDVRIVGREVHIRLGVRGPGEQVMIADLPRRGRPDPLVYSVRLAPPDDGAQSGRCEHIRSLGRDGAELRADEEPRAAGLVEGVPDFASAVPEVDRYHDGTQLGQRKVADDVLHAVTAQHRDPVTLRHAQRGQSVRQPIDFAIERSIGPRLIAPDEGGLAPEQPGMGLFAEDVTEEQHGNARCSAISLDLALPLHRARGTYTCPRSRPVTAWSAPH